VVPAGAAFGLQGGDRPIWRQSAMFALDGASGRQSRSRQRAGIACWRAETEETEAAPKDMTFAKFGRLLLLSMALSTAIYGGAWTPQGSFTANDTNGGASAKQGFSSGVDVLKYMRDYLSRFPNGSDYTSDRFDTVLTHDQAQALRDLGVTRIANQGGRYTVTLDKERKKSLRKADLKYGPQLSFTASDNNGVVEITGITGVQVHVSILLGWMDLKSVRVEQDAATKNTSLDVTVHTWLGDKSRTIVLGPDGKTLKGG
jgi:hypothetical protein